MKIITNAFYGGSRMTEKKDFFEKQKELLNEWREDVEQLRRKAKKAQISASVKFDNYMDELRGKLDEATVKVEALRKAGQSSRDQLKSSLDKTWKELKEAWDRAKSHF